MLRMAAVLVVVMGVKTLFACASAAASLPALEEVGPGEADEAKGPDVREVEARFRQLGADEGLTAGAVHHIMQDREGFVWMSTRGGVFRYDGHRFTEYKRDPLDRNSPAGSATWVTMEDQRGWIWMGHLDGGLTVYEPTKGRFHRFAAQPGVSGALQSATVTALHEDRAGRIWVGTDGGGLHRVRLRQAPAGKPEASPYDLHFTAFRADASDPQALSSDKVIDIAEDAQGRLWLATYGGGLNRFAPSTGRFTAFRHGGDGETALPGDYLMSVTRDARGGFWVGGKYSGLSYFDPHEARAVRVPLLETVAADDGRHDAAERDAPGEAPDAGSPEAAFVWRIRAEGDRVWVATYGQGLFHLQYEVDPQSGGPHIRRIVRHTSQAGASHALPDDFVLDAFRDRSGLLWVATDNEGVALLNDRSPVQLLNWRLEDRPMREAQVSAFLHDRAGRDWVGTTKGLFTRAAEAGRFEAVPLPYRARLVMRLREAADSTRWACTNHGLFLLPEGSEAPIAVLPQLRTRGLRVDDRFFDLLAVAPGRYWAGTDAGIVEIAMRDGVVQAARRVREVGALRIRRMLRIGEYVWVATSGGGLRRVHRPTGHAQRLSTGGASRIMDLAGGSAGRPVCAATYGAGVVCFPEAREGAQVVFTREDGLPDPIVKQVAFDEAGRLWAGTGKGLAYRVPGSARFSAYHMPLEDSGLIEQLFEAPGGGLLLAGAQGLLHFDANAASASPPPAPVAVTDIHVMGQPLEGEREVPWVQEVTLSPDQRFVTLEVAAMDFDAPLSNRLAYRLVSSRMGAEPWQQLTQHSTVSLYELAPGQHVFEVRSAAGASSPTATYPVTRLSLVVEPFVWETEWFRALIVVLATAAVGGLWEYRRRQRRRLERTRQRIADDLHDDIGSKMSSVALMLDVSDHQPLEERQQMVRRAALTAREVMGDLRDAVWVVDIGYDSLPALAARMRRVATTLAPHRCTLIIDEPLPEHPLGMEARRHLFLLFKEALHNAARHAGEAPIFVRLHVRDRHLVLTVADAGPGFDPNADTEGRGLHTMRSRAEALGAHFSLKAVQGRGTTITVRVPLARL